jgi:hypothetical protein
MIEKSYFLESKLADWVSEVFFRSIEEAIAPLKGIVVAWPSVFMPAPVKTL